MSPHTAAERLTASVPEIQRLWEEAVENGNPAPQSPEGPLLRSALPVLLERLASLFRGETGADQAWLAAARTPADECARVREPTLPRLLGEFGTLRRVVLQTLDRTEILPTPLREDLTRWMEGAMLVAATRYGDTQRERARREEAQHRLLVENARDYAMLLTDCAGLITSWSTGAERLTGFTEAEILGQSGAIIFTPEDRANQEPEKEMGKARALGRAENERWHLRKDGSRFWGSGIMHAVYDDSGEQSGFGKVFRDRTAEREAEEERKRLLQEAQHELARRHRLETDLRRTNERLRLLSEIPATLLLSRDPEQIVAPAFRRLAEHLDLDIYVNFLVAPDRASLQLSSYSGIPEEIANHLQVLQFGEAVCGTVAAERRAMVSDAVQDSPNPLLAVARSLGIQAYACYPLVAGDRLVGTLSFGSRRRREFTADELDLIETVSNQVAVAVDRATLIRDLADRAAALTEADLRKDEFLAMLAHELRNPLAPVLTSVAVMRLRSQADPALQRSLETVERQARQLTRLVDDLLDVSRITRGTIELRHEAVDLLAIVGHAVETSRPLMEGRSHELIVSVPRDPLCVEGDPTRLEQILINLLSNAARYTDPGGRIWLSAETEGETAVLRVRDTGRGIPGDMLRHVFDLFTQVDVTLDRSAGGLGLGLTLVKRLVEMHGGEVTAFSAGAGRGSEFTVRLPRLRPEAVLPVEAPPLEPAPTAVRPLRILVVDDNVDAAHTMADLLELWGHETRIALDGHSALTAAETLVPEVVLLDIGLPGLDGYEVARRIRASGPPGPLLVAVTGYGQEEDRRRALEAGFNHHLTKPVDPMALHRLLARAAETAVSSRPNGN